MNRRLAWWPWLLALFIVVGVGSYFFMKIPGPADGVPLPLAPIAAASKAEVHQFCAACHAYPTPDSFPRHLWRKEVKRGYDFFRRSEHNLPYPSLEAIVRYYEERAPEALALPDEKPAARPFPVRFERTAHRIPGETPAPAVSNVQLVHLFDKKKLDVLACDMRSGQIVAYQPYLPNAPSRVLAQLQHPARAEVVDLDGDGIKDLIVADLGSFPPTDDKVGRVVWLKGTPSGLFEPHTLLEDVGRVADVQPADFNGDGKLDLVVAVFGWHKSGGIVYLENRTKDPARPSFLPHVVDGRHGAIHVPVVDLNGDGRPDFVALLSQEFETVVAFLNEGDGRFRQEIIHAAPHPAYGSSGIQLVDMNADGRLDVLYTNGDVLDSPEMIKPYHGVQWLENKGDFPFVHHALAALPGAHSAVAADVDGDGDLDVLAVSLLPPPEQFPRRKDFELDSVILLEQTSSGLFNRHALEKNACDHVTCAAGDLFGDGRSHLVIGNFSLSRQYQLPAGWTLWKNLGR